MNTNKKHVAVILGARPNFVKAAPFFREAKKYSNFIFTVIHTGQHFDDNMSRIFFEEMGLPRPDIHLDIRGQFHTEKIGKMFNALNNIFSENIFDLAVVFGDVNSTLAGALSAVKNNCKLVHIEAGLRSHDRRMPEEINRVIVDHISDFLFTTEPSANDNLVLEGIAPEKIKYVGNIMVESLEIFEKNINQSQILEKLKLDPKEYVIATIHRQENVDDIKNFNNILLILSEIAKRYKVIFPIHPGTMNKIKSYGLESKLDNFTIIDPLGYFEFIKLVKDSCGVVTDSGGIQEETTHLGVACCTLRDNTERPITLTLGSNKLFTLENVDYDELFEHLDNKNFKIKPIAMWDSNVSKRIFSELYDIDFSLSLNK